MFDLILDSGGEKQNITAQAYDLCLDRRVLCRRKVFENSANGQHKPELKKFNRRHHDRRIDKRPLEEFPYLPSLI